VVCRQYAPVSGRGITLRSSRLAAVRWPGASAPRASQVHVSVRSARGGRERLSERTLGRRFGRNAPREITARWTFDRRVDKLINLEKYSHVKQTFGYFAVGFVLMGVTGLIHGYRVVHSPEAIAAVAVRAIRPETFGNAKFFVYRVSGRVKYRWNVDSHHLEKFNTLAELKTETAFDRLFAVPLSQAQILTFAGGGAATWKLKDLLSTGDATTKRNIIASMLGGISGYLVGYKIGSSTLPAVDSEEVRRSLSEEKFWNAHANDMYLAMLLQFHVTASHIANGDARRNVQEYIEMLAYSWERSGRIEPEHVAALSTLYEKFQRGNALNPELKATPWWLTWWFTLGSVAVAVILCLAIATVNQRRSKRGVPLVVIAR